MHGFQVIEELRFVPERLQAHAASDSVVFVVKELKSGHDLLT